MSQTLTIRLAGDPSGYTSALSKASASSSTFFKGVTAGSAAAVVAIGGIVVAASKIGGEFEQQMRFVGAVTDSTISQFQDLSEAARDVGSSTEHGAVQAAGGLKFLAMSGLDAEESIAALGPASDLATAGMISLTQAADISTNIMKQFGLEVEDLSMVNDVLAKTATSSNTTIEQAAQAFIMGGTMASQMGMKVSELAGFIGLLADRGIKSTLAGTALRQTMLRMLNPTDDNIVLMEKYGLTLRDADGDMKNFTEVILDLADAHMSEEEAAQLLGARASQMTAIFKLSREELEEQLGVVEDSEGAMKSLADAMRDSFSGQMDIMINKVNDSLLELFMGFGGMGIEVFQMVGDSAEKLTKKIAANKDKILELFLGVITVGKVIYASFEALWIGLKSGWQTMALIFNSTMAVINAGSIGLAKSLRAPLEESYGSLENLKEISAEADAEFIRLGVRLHKIKATGVDQTTDSFIAMEAQVDKARASAEHFSDNILLWEDQNQIINENTIDLEFFNEEIKSNIDVLDEYGKKIISNFTEIPEAYDVAAAKMTAAQEKFAKGGRTEDTSILGDVTQKQSSRISSQGPGTFESATPSRAANFEGSVGEEQQEGALTSFAAIEDPAERVGAINAYYDDVITAQRDGNDAYVQSFTEITEARQEALAEAGATEEGKVSWFTGMPEIEAINERYDELIELTSEKEGAIQDGKAAAANLEIRRDKALMKAKLKIKAQQGTQEFGMMASNLQAIAQLGGKHGKKAFTFMKKAQIAQTLMNTYSSATSAFSGMTSFIPGPIGIAMGVAAAAFAVGAGLANVKMIRQQEAPTFDEGGISTTPGYYYAGIREAHIPLASGDRIPIDMGDQSKAGGPTIILNNPVFQDLEAQRAVMAEIASTIVSSEAPAAIVESYNNDEEIRSLILNGDS